MHNDNLDRSIRAAMGDAHATPTAEAAMDAALASIAQEAASGHSRTNSQPSARRAASNPFAALRWARAAAVACAVCLCAGGTAYAADKLGLFNLQQSGDYQTMMAVDAGTPETGAVVDYRIEIANLPADAVELDRADYLAKYQWTGDKSISASLFYLDSSEALPVSFTTGSIPLSIDDREGILFEKAAADGGEAICDAYFVFPDERRILRLWAEGLTDEELAVVAEAVSLEPTGRTVVPGAHGGEGDAADYLPTWSEEIAAHQAEAQGPTEEGEMEPLKLTASTNEMGTLHAVGDTFPLACNAQQTWEDPDAAGCALAAKVTSVDVESDLSALDADRLPEGWSDLVSSDGTLGNATIRYLKFGDGRDSINTVLDEQHVPVKLVRATIEYENAGTESLDEILVYASLVKAQEADGSWSIFDRAKLVTEAEDAQCAVAGLIDSEMRYWKVDDAHKMEKNYVSHLEPGEKAITEAAWIVPADELDKLLLNLSGAGSWHSFDEADLAQGYVDIRRQAA